MKSISIIGCGWLGLPLAKYLTQNNYLVKGSTTRIEKLSLLKETDIQPFLLNLKKGASYDKALFDSKFFFINIPPGRRNPNLLSDYPDKISTLLSHIPSSSKIIFASSTGVYANSNKTVDEKTLPNPVRDSGKAKLLVEKIIKKKFPSACILRFAGLVGGDRKAGSFLSGKTNLSNGEAKVNLVHLEDCIQIIHACLESEISESEIFNVVADEHPTRKQFYTHRANQEGFVAPTFKEGLPANKIVSNNKLKRLLAYEFLYPNPMSFPV